MRKLSGINFNYICRLHHDKNLIYPEVQAARIVIKWKLSSQVPNLLVINTKHYIKYNSKYKNSCYVFFCLHHSKLKKMVDQKSLLMTELKKFIELLLFHKGILPMWLKFSFKTSVCLEGYVLLYKRKRLIYRY